MGREIHIVLGDLHLPKEPEKPVKRGGHFPAALLTMRGLSFFHP